MDKTLKIRFKDNGESLTDFGEEFLVFCPNCNKCANVTPKFKEVKFNKNVYFQIDSAKLTCFSCGFSKIKEKIDTIYLGDYDFYFKLPLWLE